MEKNKKLIVVGVASLIVIALAVGIVSIRGKAVGKESNEVKYTDEQQAILDELDAELARVESENMDPETDIPVKDIQIDRILGSIGGYNMQGEFIQIEIDKYDTMYDNYNRIKDADSEDYIRKVLLEDGYTEDEITAKLIEETREEIKKAMKESEEHDKKYLDDDKDEADAEMQQILDKYGLKLEDVQEEYRKAEEKADAELEEYLKEQEN